MSDVPVFGSYEHRYQNACAEIRRMKSESEAKDQRIAEFTQISRELIRNADYDTGSAGQVYVDEGSLQALGRVLASEDTRKEASSD